LGRSDEYSSLLCEYFKHQNTGTDIMPGEFIEIARSIARRGTEEPINVSMLLDIVFGMIGEGNINCYPGTPGEACHNLALFCSLNGSLKTGGGHYGFEQILQFVVRHFQGNCPGQTSAGIIVTDLWMPGFYEKWRSNLHQIMANGVRLEFYLIGVGGWATEIPI
jgi:hypothetical protein